MTAVLELEGVTKTYPGPVEVLHGVSLAVAAGELAAVVGPSGSGKSTLLHIMGTLERATAGAVRVAGHDVAAMGEAELAALRAHRIGFVFQQFFLLDGMSALDNVATGLLYGGLPRGGAAGGGGRGAGPRRPLAPGRGTCRRSSRAASASAWRSRGRCSAGRRSSSPTSRRATSTRARARGSWRCCTSCTQDGATILVITHDEGIAATLPRRIALRDGRVESDTGAPLAVAS